MVYVIIKTAKRANSFRYQPLSNQTDIGVSRMTAKNCTTKRSDKQPFDLVHGVGIKSKGKYKFSDNGVPTKVYDVWRRMISRCYCLKTQARTPSYIGCSVHPDWHDFQDFAEWFEGHKYSNLDYQLDKDILKRGNKVYGPDTCCLVPQELNSVIVSRHTGDELYPQGVYFQRAINKFSSRISVNGRKRHLGCFLTADDAYKAYVVAKEAYVKEKAIEWKDRIEDRVFDALMAWTVL